MKKIELHNCDNLNLMAKMPDESVDVILTDPPYLYLKGQKLERPFDEEKFFAECKRLLTKNGFIVLFGRGESFYRWNTILAGLGFTFKEEIVWDKRCVTSPLMKLSRVHETISIFTKGKGTINKVKVPYLEMKGHDIDSIVTDIKRLKTCFKNTKSLNAVLTFLENNEGKDNEKIVRNDRVECETFTRHYINTDKRKTGDRNVNVMQSITYGLNEKSIVRVDRKIESVSKNKVSRDIIKDGERCVNVMQSFAYGLNEKSIVRERRDHYATIHPTQKPVRLLERLLALVVPKEKQAQDIVVFDPFGGSFSTMEACHNMGLRGISCEIDKEYFEAGRERLHQSQTDSFNFKN